MNEGVIIADGSRQEILPGDWVELAVQFGNMERAQVLEIGENELVVDILGKRVNLSAVFVSAIYRRVN